MVFVKNILNFILCVIVVSLPISYAATEHSSGFLPVDHGNIYYERYGAGTPIVVIHGGPGLDQGYLKPQLLSLANNHEVIFYDQRGSGKSLDTDMSRNYIKLDQFTKDLEAVRQLLNVDNIILLGHSWGAIIAMDYTLKYPEHVAKLILVGPMPADIAGKQAAAAELDKRTEPFRDEIAALDTYDEFEKLTADQINALYRKVYSVFFFNPKEADKLTFDLTLEAARSGFKVNQLMMPDMFINFLPRLKNLKVPALVISGENDVVPMWTTEQIVRAIPNAKLIRLSNCGHFPYIEKPDEFMQAINS